MYRDIVSALKAANIAEPTHVLYVNLWCRDESVSDEDKSDFVDTYCSMLEESGFTVGTSKGRRKQISVRWERVETTGPVYDGARGDEALFYYNAPEDLNDDETVWGQTTHILQRAVDEAREAVSLDESQMEISVTRIPHADLDNYY